MSSVTWCEVFCVWLLSFSSVTSGSVVGTVLWLYRRHIFSSTHGLRLGGSTSGLLLVMYRFLSEHTFSFLLGICTEVGSLGHMATSCTFGKLPEWFSKGPHRLTPQGKRSA